MSLLQKRLLSVFLPVTALFLLLDNMYPGAAFVDYMKFLNTIALFVTAVWIKKDHLEKKLLTISLFFVMLGDFFLVFYDAFFKDSGNVLPLGILSFSIAYLLVTAAFQKNFRITRCRLLAVLPVLGLTIPVFVTLLPLIQGIFKYGLILFVVILGYCSWICLGTVCGGYFTTRSSHRIALAGFLMLICDLGVGLSLFHPSFAGHFVPWIKNIIWGAYVPAWSLIVVTIAEKNLKKTAD